MNFYVYALIDPRFPKRYYYIGYSSKLDQRIQQHSCSPHCHPLYEWIRSLKKVGLKPSYVILQSFKSQEKALKAEQRWIEGCRSQFLINRLQAPGVIQSCPNNSPFGALKTMALENAVKTLEDNGHNISRTAKLLGISRQTLYRMLTQWQILTSSVPKKDTDFHKQDTFGF